MEREEQPGGESEKNQVKRNNTQSFPNSRAVEGLINDQSGNETTGESEGRTRGTEKP